MAECAPDPALMALASLRAMMQVADCCGEEFAKSYDTVRQALLARPLDFARERLEYPEASWGERELARRVISTRGVPVCGRCQTVLEHSGRIVHCPQCNPALAVAPPPVPRFTAAMAKEATERMQYVSAPPNSDSYFDSLAYILNSYDLSTPPVRGGK